MIGVAKGLVVREPWVDLILSGQKTWEMRATSPSWRGWFGLIRKGSGVISGIARLADVGRPLSPDEMVRTFDKHCIPEAMIRSGEVAKWTTPWILANVQRLPRPVRYSHPYGAITLFTLERETSEVIAAQLGSGARVGMSRPELPAVASILAQQAAEATPLRVAPASQKPAAADSSGPGMFLGEAEVTQGNLKNSHFYLRGFLNRFPEELVGGRDRPSPVLAKLETDDEHFATTTDICPTHRFFRDRSWTRSFFERSAARPGDRVAVHELGPYRYQISLRRSDVA